MKQFLLNVESRLRALGFDAYTQIHPRARELAPGLSPAAMTRALERLSDLTTYIGVHTMAEKFSRRAHGPEHGTAHPFSPPPSQAPRSSSFSLSGTGSTSRPSGACSSRER